MQPLLTVDFHRFIIIFPYGRTEDNPMNSSFNCTSFILKVAKLLKFSMVPVSVGF